jgi:hypothetical protein
MFNKISLSYLTIMLTLGMTASAAHAQESPIEIQAMRCSALTLIHSSLTVPSPQFGQVMGELVGFFTQIHAVQKGIRTKTRIASNELQARRDALVAELSRGWPGNKAAMIREAGICNIWRAEFFAKLNEKSGEKELQAAFVNISAPPTTITKAETDKWTKLTPQAFAGWAEMKVAPVTPAAPAAKK